MVSNFRKMFIQKSYLCVSLIGKSYQLNINYSKVESIEMNILDNEINLVLPKEYKDDMDIVNLCIQKLYNKVANTEVEYAMEFARHIFGFAPEDFKIKRLENDYYKYANKTLTINPDIVQFSEEIIYTTILRAFCKIKYRAGSKNYLNAMEIALKEYQKYKGKKQDNELWLKVS